MEYTSKSPSHFYSLAFCVHLIAYVTSLIAAFSPDWSEVKESNAGVEVTYDKGIIVSCGIPGGPSGCGFNKDMYGSSTLFFVCFLLVIAYILIGFLALQLLLVGICVRSLKERNLGVPLVVLFFLLVVTVIASIVLFESSIPVDVTAGSDYLDHTFGLSRKMLVVCTLLYFICAFFALGEFFKRKTNNSISHENTRENSLDSLPPIHTSNRQQHQPKERRNNNNYNHKNYNINKNNSKNNNNNYNNNNSNGRNNDTGRKFIKRENPYSTRVPYNNYNGGRHDSNPRHAHSSAVTSLEGHTYFD